MTTLPAGGGAPLCSTASVIQAAGGGEQATACAWDIEVKGLWKNFGVTEALRGVNLRVSPGERLAVMGPNGSGKSTLVKVVATLLRPSAGTARLAGLDVQRQAVRLRRLIGVVCHQSFLYGELTALENLEFYARLYGLPDPSDRARQQLRQVGLEGHSDVMGRDLSRGMQQRLALARALVHEPPILLLDEPDTGLDQRWTGFLVDLLAEAAGQGRTVLLTTHDLERSLDMADRLAVLNGGRVVFTAKRDGLNVGSLKEAYLRYTGAVC
jgi:heme exporter protein A